MTIKIGHHNYRIEYKDVIKLEDGGLADGQCHKYDKVITMSEDLNNQDFRDEILLHEIVHGIIFESGYEFDTSEQEEEFVYTFSKTLHGFLKDNNEFVSRVYKRRDEDER